MPNRTIHLQVAGENESLASQLDMTRGVARGWAATISFYAALHYVEAFFSEKNIHSASHRTRDSNLYLYNETMAIYAEFSELKNISTNARYFGRYPSMIEYSDEVVPALKTVRAEMQSHL